MLMKVKSNFVCRAQRSFHRDGDRSSPRDVAMLSIFYFNNTVQLMIWTEALDSSHCKGGRAQLGVSVGIIVLRCSVLSRCFH
jgi:hypothetical protein